MTHPLLQKLGTLSPLTDEEGQALVGAVSRTVTVEADQDIVVEGEPSSECRVLLDGFAARYKLLPEGKRQIVSFGLPGDTLDLDALVSGRTDHGAEALSSCTVGLIPHRTLGDLTARHPGIARALWSDSVLDAAIFREWVVNVGRRSAYQRVAHLLCETLTRLRAIGRAEAGEPAFAWPVMQSDLGDATGLSVVHVNRTLQKLRGEGLIGPRSDEVTILDWPGLQRAGGFSPDYLSLRPG